MRRFALSVILFLILFAAYNVAAYSQCRPGYVGPFSLYPVSASYVDANGINHDCQFAIHYCVKTWNDGLITRWSYDYWIEAIDCPLSAMPQGEMARVYQRLGQSLVEANPQEFPYPLCGFQDNHTIVDVSHASCVYEEVINHATPEDPNAKDTWAYHSCSGTSGLCYERYWVCYECIYGNETDPPYGCKKGPNGDRPQKLTATKTDSWTTGSGTCGTITMPWGEVPCITVCGADKPGPDLGLLIRVNESSTFATDTVQTTTSSNLTR